MVFTPSETEHWISAEFSRLAEIVQDYDHHLQLRWIPPDKRTRDDKKPYVIWDICSNTPVIYASELDSPVEILTKLWSADNDKGNVLTRLDAHNAAVEAMRLKEQLDEYEELNSKAAFMKATPLHYIKMGKGIKLDDSRRRMS